MPEEINDETTKRGRKKDFDPKETRKFVVRHLIMEQENSDFPIIVNTCDPKTGGLKRFLPNQPVDLTRTQVDILKKAIEESSFTVGDLGDYPSEALNAKDPVSAAKQMYPDFEIIKDHRTGIITAVKKRPRFSVEPVSEEREGWAA